jgi:hypothetical protein
MNFAITTLIFTKAPWLGIVLGYLASPLGIGIEAEVRQKEFSHGDKWILYECTGRYRFSKSIKEVQSC